MRYTQSFLSLFFLPCIMLFSVLPINTGMPGFDPNQMQNMQQELEEANRAIEEYISSLPPEEQEEFNKQVDELSTMFDNMSEEDFAAFLGEMFTEEPMPESSYEPFAPTRAPETAVEIPALTTEQKKKVENIIIVLDDIIRQ